MPAHEIPLRLVGSDLFIRDRQVHAEAGAYAGLALGMQVVLAAVLMPLVFKLL